MTKLIRSLLILLAILVNSSSQATSFNYSYIFGDGSELKGGFDGDVSDDLILNLRNFTLSWRDVPFTGTLEVSDWASRASFSGTNNYLEVKDSGGGTAITLAFLPLESRNTDLAHLYYFGKTYEDYYFYYPTGPYSADRWHVSAVPEPELWSMMVVGLGIVGYMARKRRPANLV